NLTLAAAGRHLGASPAHLVRSFTRTFGVAPHAYRLGRRIEIARQRLLDGQPPADVAVSVGFFDQSHFTRHFKRHVGTTPGHYAGTPNSPAAVPPRIADRSAGGRPGSWWSTSSAVRP